MKHPSEQPTPLSRSKSLTDQAAEAIRAMILRGELQLGEALSEMALATRLGVSKTPVREALLHLKLEGLVEIQPQRGTFVFRMSAEQVRKLGEVREIIELSALDLALRRDPGPLEETLREIVAGMRKAVATDDAERYRTLDHAFHQSIVEAARNPYLTEAYSGIAFRIQALRNRLSQDPNLNRASLDEHEQFLEALVGKPDYAALSTLLRRHMTGTEAHSLASL